MKRHLFVIICLVVITSIPQVYGQTYSQSSGNVTKTGQTYNSATTDVSAVKVTGGTLNLSSSTVSSSGNTSSSDNSSFYGLNAVILAYKASGTAIINSANNVVSSTGSGSNGIFAYGTATISSVNDNFNHTGNFAHAIMCSGGGTITAENDTAVTAGSSSSVIATDRGSGTITVTGGSYTANGDRSAAVYSTGVINCSNATLIATKAEALVIEGENRIILNNCTTECTFNKWGSLIYQSMSGDAEGTDGYLTINGGSFTYTGTDGGMFYNTNSTAYITLKGVTLHNNCDTLLRCIKGSWGGSTASSGGITYLVGDGQTLSGLIHTDAHSKTYVTLQNTSSFTGTINKSNTASLVKLTMDASSNWTLTDNSHINGLITNPGISGITVSNITGNGYNVYYATSTNSVLEGRTYSLTGGGYLLPEGATSVNTFEESTARLTLNQNYPNPVTNSTTISYYIKSASSVLLTVYNSNGQIVETLINGQQAEGNHTMSWTPRLPSGIYTCILTSNGEMDSKKITISR